MEIDTSIYIRKERRPSGLPTPAERVATPIVRPRTGPPTKDHRVFSSGTLNKSPSSIGSSGASSDLPSSSETDRRPRRVIRKNLSTDTSYSLGNGSTTSVSASGYSHISSKNGAHTSVLGITLPATSASSQQNLNAPHLHHSRQWSGSVPRLLTQDLPVPLGSSSMYDSSPATGYTDSPFSHASTPSSASSYSSSPAAMARTISSSPSRPPVTRKRAVSQVSVEGSDLGLDPVRESTISNSSDSTVRAKRNSGSNVNTPPIPKTTTPVSGKAPKLAPSPQLVPKAPTPRPRWGSGPSICVKPSKETPTASPSAPSLAKTRTKSISSQQKGRKDSVTPPQRSPAPATPSTTTTTTTQQNTPRQGLVYNTVPPPSSTKPSIIKPGFFSRGRTKSEEKAPEKVPEKVVRRGPTAGTGYEGYGAFGKASRGRNGSTGVVHVRSGSQTSVMSRSRSGSRPGSRGSMEMDDYFMDRLKPVVIMGGEVVENYNRPVDMVRSGSSPAAMETTPDRRLGAEINRSGSSLGVFSRGPSPAPVSPKSERETVAHRRANAVVGRAMTPIPAPINTAVTKLLPAPSPVPSTISSVSSSRKQSLEASETSATPKPRSRWNIFAKSHTKVAAAAQVVPAMDSVTPVPLVPRSVIRRNIPAHYALLDGDEQREAQELVERMYELRQKRMAAPAAEPSPSSSSPSIGNYAHTLRKQQNSIAFPDKSILLPLYRKGKLTKPDKKARARADNIQRPATVEPVSSKADLPPPPPVPAAATTPPTTGRVGAHVFDADTMPSPEEFQINWNSYGLTPTDAPSGLERSKDFLEYDPLDIRGRKAARSASLGEETPIFLTESDWLSRKGSMPRTPVEPLAVVVQEEEEQEEFFSELEGLYGLRTPAAAYFPVLKRTDTVRSTTSSLGSPFQYSDLCSPIQSVLSSSEEKSPEATQQEEEDEEPCTPDSPTLPAFFPPKKVPDDIPHLTMLDVLGPDQPLPYAPGTQNPTSSPGTPFSMNSFIRYYGAESDSPRELPTHQLPTHQLDSPKLGHKSTDSTGSTSTTKSAIVVDDEMKIRPWALLASRWLSFDRVLVSPSHQQLQAGSGERVLVVDGLGTDDWSFYCALSYPSAKVYNLSQAPHFPTTAGPPASPSVPRPKNHKQVRYPSFASSFPFPKAFFNVICFRFLPSSSDAHWPFILSECKRVLQPGGYLEVTLLDAELINAGPRAKRAVSLVKAIMQRENGGAHPVRPASEKVLRILAKRGFEGISKCFVGLPAVGAVEKDPEAIEEVVGKVGRWWYSRCYEGVITAGGEEMGRSMWADRGLLRECKRRQTSFRMMVCCARKPVGRRESAEVEV